MAMPMTVGYWISKAVQENCVSSPKSQKPVGQTRCLSAGEMKAMTGKWTKNPYVAGANKWSVSYKGVDLLTGNFSTSATDMSFEGGYGIPVNVTRSYSSNCADEGPLGIGWNLSVDVRSTAGGILKSSGAPIRSVPTGFKERPALTSATNDPNAVMADGSATQPPEAVLAMDASGKEETEQRDVDGIITTPPWDKNTNNATYEFVTFGGSEYQILYSNDVTTPDGTVYHYVKEGDYGTGGVTSFDGTSAATPSNVLKIQTATDRQGNVTHYYYKSGTVSFVKANGTTTEHGIDYITMPNGHRINFTWGDTTHAPTNRIWKIDDNVSGGRTVTYGYDSGNLHTVQSPAGLTTTYAYDGSDTGGSTSYTTPATDLLTSITDPRGLQTTIHYYVEEDEIMPYMVVMPAVKAWKVVSPSGVSTYYANQGASSRLPTSSYFYSPTGAIVGTAEYADIASGASTPFQRASLSAAAMSTTPPTVVVGMEDIGGYNPGSHIPGQGTWLKTYDARSQDLLDEVHYVGRIDTTFLEDRKMVSDNGFTKVHAATEYNFMGNPLSRTVTESATSSSSSASFSNTRVQTTDYAYWGADKYFQQKATRIQTGSSTYRYSYTDYFDSSSDAGYRGQTHYVYSPAFTSFSLDTGITPPSGTSSGDYWKYQLVAGDPTTSYVAKFDYDDKGRPTDVWKLQTVSGSTYNRVQTHTTYGSDGAGHWGQAETVVEDYGTGKINRTTTTNGYTVWGQANDVTDAAGHEFVTDFDLDGKVNSITRVDTTPDKQIVAYTYGTSGIENGMPTNIIDGLTGLYQDYAYNDGSSSSPGNANYIGGKGQIQSVVSSSSTDLGIDNTVSYTYNAAGDRETATYETPNGTTKWGYYDYVPVGDPASPSRVFQTLNKLDSSGDPTTEEMDYSYDGSGRLLAAVFAQTPQSGHGYEVAAASRALAIYTYDAGGRTLALEHYWQTGLSSGVYGTVTKLVKNECTYEVSTGTSNANRGLKTDSTYYLNSSGSWSSDRAESYSYDSNLDYLTSANYGTGATTWTYDAAGNRSNSGYTYDNLNRMTESPGSHLYLNDILGNRTWRDWSSSNSSAQRYTWDEVGRMFSFCTPSSGAKYIYRADGMRVEKVEGLSLNWIPPSSDEEDAESSGYYDSIWATNKPTTRYYYDGQMCMEDDYTAPSTFTKRKYGIGARGIDFIENWSNSTTIASTQFPIYDCHGNMIATIVRPSSGSATLADTRYFDAWGSPSNSSGPKQKYCANLGHAQDDESGLIYMRARYYEPSTGRFVSEDPSKAGKNWLIYCGDCPTSFVDPSGRDMTAIFGAFLSGIVSVLCRYAANGGNVSGQQLINAFLCGVAAYSAARLGGRVTEAMEVGGSATLGGWLTGMSTGGFTNAVATLLINSLTGEDTSLADIFLSFICGGIGSASSYGLSDVPKGSGQDQALGLFMGAMSELGSRF